MPNKPVDCGQCLRQRTVGQLETCVSIGHLNNHYAKNQWRASDVVLGPPRTPLRWQSTCDRPRCKHGVVRRLSFFLRNSTPRRRAPPLQMSRGAAQTIWRMEVGPPWHICCRPYAYCQRVHLSHRPLQSRFAPPHHGRRRHSATRLA
jgi:hypothetical protein